MTCRVAHERGRRVPRVSIGMPVYNGERFINEALSSLLGQTFDDLEVIISDNASTDRTEDKCREYVARDKRVRYYRNRRNLGISWNYRRVFEASSGPYFKWATYDDVCAPEFVARCVEALDRDRRVVLAHPRARIINEFGDVGVECGAGLHLQSPRASERIAQLFRNLRLSNALYGVIRRDVLRETPLVGDFPAADIPLLAELSLRGLFYEIPECLFSRRIHPGAASARRDDQSQLEVYNPDKVGRVVFREWRLLYEYCRSVRRVPLPLREQMRVGLLLLKSGVWNWDELIRELVGGARASMGMLRH
jgi:glycosyltransferase involved in cell wall biosynthesis